MVLIATSNCGKKNVKESFTTFPSPNWTVDSTGRYPVSMTAVVQIPEKIKSLLQPKDKFAAFIKDECRSLGVPVNLSTTSPVYYFLIKGTATEGDKVTFKYFSATTSYMFTTTPLLDFSVDGNFGTADNPEQLTMNGIK